MIFSQFGLIFANDETFKIDNFSYKEGLTTARVNCTYKDYKGFLWFGTMNGLFRYDGYGFRNLNTLTNNVLNYEVLCLIEDNEHNFWIGTTGKGIFHLNTHNEKLTHVALRLGSNANVNQILFFQNKIWAATNIGLLSINPNKVFNENDTLNTQSFLPNPFDKNSQDNIINTLYAIPFSDNLWVGTNGLLNVFNINTNQFQTINTYGQNSIRSLSKYSDKIVAASWDGGIFSINPKSLKLENDLFIQYVNQILGNKRVKSVIFDNQNRLWVATYGKGLFIFFKNKNFSVYNYKSNDNLDENIKSNFINQLYLDKSGIIWLSMEHSGLTKIYSQKNNISYTSLIKTQLEQENKEIIEVNPTVDKNKLWISTNGNGIFLFDIQSCHFTQYTNLAGSKLKLLNNDISSCYQDSKGNLWIVYRRIGLYVVPADDVFQLLNETNNNNIVPIDANILLSPDIRLNSYITKFYNDSQGRLWIGSWGALSFIDVNNDFLKAKNTNTLRLNSKVTNVYFDERRDEINFPIAPVLSILEVQKNTIWIGTQGSGIIKFDETTPNKYTGKLADFNDQLPNLNVNFLLKDNKQGVWIGTNSGLSYWKGENVNLKIITKYDGLNSDNIYNIVEDNQSNLWLSTTYGISKVNSKDFSIQNYIYNHKENYNQYIPNASALAANGIVCFSSDEAIVTINPNSEETQIAQTPIYITDIKIDNQKVTPLEKFNGTNIINTNINECKIINVPYNHTLRLEFAALDFISSEQLLYKYNLGNSKEWIILNANQRNLSLPNLKPGLYTLRIMLANSPKNNSERQIQINYLPPIWQTFPAYVVYIIVLLLLIYTYRKLTIQRIFQKSQIEKERHDRKKLEELDKLKSEFFSNISHEFRTPLSLIINPLEKLSKDEEISNKNKERIKLILKSSDRLLKLTNELMDFSKVEKKLLVPEFEPCEIVQFVKNTCQLFNNLADSMNIDFKINSPFEKLSEIHIDKGMIEKVLFNILSNAFKYTPNYGIVLVNISTYNEMDIEYIKIEVINTGEGIAKEDIENIFDRFYQVKNLQNRKIEGTGIGLALVKNFVELHHGRIEVKSEPNIETCFEVYLPVKQINYNTQNIQDINIADNNIQKPELEPSYQLIGKKQKPHYKLLLVEDESDMRDFIIEELSDNFKITSAKNGEEGVILANEIIPDLIITDVMMPVMSGIELCRILKNQMSTSHIPIIILSAKASVDHQVEGLEMGADVYMIKPFNIDHLKTQVFRLINFKESIYARYLKETTLIPQGTLVSVLDEVFIQKVMKFIEDNLINPNLSVDQLASYVSLSKVQTYRKIKAISGLSIVEFIKTIRLKKAATLVLEKKMSYTEIAFETGFASHSYFTKCFHEHFGKSPTDFALDYDNA